MRVSMQQIAGNAALNLVIQPLWDTVQFGTSNTAPINVFSVPRGQSSKTTVETNLVQSGGIPSPNEFYLRAFMIFPVARRFATAAQAITDVTDLGAALESGIFSFYVGTSGSKLVEAHGHVFPCGMGVQGMFTTGGATSSNVVGVIGNGIRDLTNRFGLGDYAEKLNATESFSAQFTFPQGTLSLSNSISMRVYLAGIYGQSMR